MTTPADLDLEQFRSLRSEIMRLMEDSNAIMNYSLVVFGAIVAGGLSLKGSSSAFFAYAVILPLFSSVFFSLWYAAYERLARASYFVTGVERRLAAAAAAPSHPMWDTWLRGAGPGTSRHFWSFEYSGAAIYSVFMVLPVPAALAIDGGVSGAATTIPTALAVLFYDVAFFWSMRSRFKRATDWLTSVCPD